MSQYFDFDASQRKDITSYRDVGHHILFKIKSNSSFIRKIMLA